LVSRRGSHRYRTGDCRRDVFGEVQLRRNTPPARPVLGRKNQKLKFKCTSLFPRRWQAVLEETKGVESFVVVARAENECATQ